MVNIRFEIDKKKDILKNAPHTARVVSSDKWEYNYSREEAAYPVKQTNKFWPAISRIDNVYGDRNLVCSCANYFDNEDGTERLVEFNQPNKEKFNR